MLLILKKTISHSMSRVKPIRNTARTSLYSAWVFCNALTLLPGMACWSEGQRHKMQLRSDWDAVKIDIMYRCFLLHLYMCLRLHARHFQHSAHDCSSLCPNSHAARVNAAKYAANPSLQADLLSTGHQEMRGAPSTGWNTAGVTHTQFYNRKSVMMNPRRCHSQLEHVEWFDSGWCCVLSA